jgi:ribosome-associated translation inhibitor RaiA
MQILLNTDNRIQGSVELTQTVESTVGGALQRFGQRLTRVEVSLMDVNSSQKGGADDIRCAIEARLAGLQPIACTHHAPTLELALDGALEKLERTLDRTLEKAQDPRGHSPTA